jgi:hypothetical protein
LEIQMKKLTLGMLAAGAMWAGAANALPIMDLPKAGSPSATPGVDSNPPPVNLGQLNSVANFVGLQWPIMLPAGGGVGAVGTEVMFWDILSLNAEGGGASIDIGVPGVNTTESHYYFDFNLPITVTSDLFGAAPAWTYNPGGTVTLCLDDDATLTGGHNCDVALATMTVTGGGGALDGVVAGSTQKTGDLNINAIVASQVTGLFTPKAVMNFHITSIFSDIPGDGVDDVAGAGGMKVLQTFSGDSTPLGVSPQQITTFTAPEPASVALIGLGLLAVGGVASRRRVK